MNGPTKNPLKALPPRFRVGDHVRVPFGRYTFIGTIVEDRGPLGAGGRRLYGVTYDRGMPEPSYREIPEDELELADTLPTAD